MATEPIGITFVVPENQDAIGVYEAEGGAEVFETDEPYLLSDGRSLVDPMPVRMVDGPIYQDTLGNAQSALAITLVSSWSPADLFANGEQGALWGPLPYYSDAAGTVEADWGDPVGNIPDASGNGQDWTQVTSTARPILGRVPVGGRRNLLRSTEDFGNAAWDKLRVTIAPGIKAPNGVSLGKLVEGLENDTHFARQSTTFPANSTSLQTLYAKAGERSWIYFGGLGRLPSATEGYTWFNLADGTIGTVSANHAILEYASIGDGVYKIVILCAASPTSTIREFRFGAGTGDLTPIYQGDGVSGVYVGGAQLETGSVATPYQRVGNEYDITEAGVKGIHYLRFDGTDDQVTTTLPAISGGTIVLAGTNGIWIDSLDFAGGAFSVGPGTYTGGPAGLMSILGDILVGGGFVIDRALTPEEIAQVKRYYKARGAGDFFVPLDTSVVAVIRPTVNTAPADWIRYHNGKSYPDGPEWQAIIDTHPAYAGIASEVIDGQHMVKVPKFYVQTKDTAAGGVIYLVSDKPRPGFQVHPAFFNAGEEIDQFWIGAYHASEVDNVFESQPSVLPRVLLSGATAITRMEARNTGGQSGWGSLTWHQICAVRLLCLIEAGTPNVRSAIGQGWNSTTSNSGSGAELQPTGTGDANWRGIYDLWGNLFVLCTGLEFRDGRAWLADESGDLVDTGHDMPASRYIGACAGGDLAWAFLPAADGPTGTAAGYAAYQWMNLTATQAARHGGSFDASPPQVGLFSFRGNSLLSAPSIVNGYRLAKV